MSELVKIWLNDFEKAKKTVLSEIEEVKNAISDEKLYAKGSQDKDTASIHAGNIAVLQEYLDALLEKVSA